jgi:hypothetical protein
VRPTARIRPPTTPTVPVPRKRQAAQERRSPAPADVGTSPTGERWRQVDPGKYWLDCDYWE